MPHANLAEADRPERAKACAHGHDGHVHGHADENADGHGRSESCAHDHAHSHTESACCGTAHAAAAPVKLPQSEAVGSDLRTSIRIMQMDCPTEEALIRKKFSRMPSVRSMDFNLMQRVLTVVHAPDALETILAAIRSLDFTPELADANPDAAAAAPQAPSKPWWPLVLAGIAAVGSEAASWLGAPVWLAAGLALLAIVSCGLTTYKKGWVAIRNGNLNINALMSIAVTGALILQQWPEAAMVMVLFTIAELIEAKSLDRARNAIQGLMQLTPEQASVQQADGSWRLMDLKAIALGAVVRVKPGERIALDGEIVAGRSSVDQAPITGESLPVDKTVGDAVFAGTINQAGSFDYRVTAAASNTTLARIIHAVEEAQGTKAPTQRFVDQFARVYTPIVFVAALAVAVLPPLLFGGQWHEWIYKALVMLVIACPCALVISTPVTIVSGLAAAARKGILIKGGAYLEQGRKLSRLALDKTGTITHGKPVQTEFEILADVDVARCRTLAASLAGRSDHPVSMAIAAAAKSDSIASTSATVKAFEALAGRGVRGDIDGLPYWLGNHRLVEELGRCSASLEARLDALEGQGKTVVMLVDAERVLALFAVADTVKDTSRAAIAELQRLGVRAAMLTGDNPHTAAAIAQQVGIDEARGNQLPEDKLSAVAQWSQEGATVGMVGDGINDAPALARADIGFAMGAMGTDTAIETADVALMDDDLRKIPQFIRLSKATHSVLVQNITLALGIKSVFLVLTMMGLGTMWMAVFADVGASLLVVANGLRLLRS
ncbi:heavy metal translocating P-type ATPase [Paraburkholderia aspalathi]|uniref:P-type Zn(2+) transporter n=1 Tax=Paraburkholderia nemoris TaxID=2793076 RepID=A0ABM8S875_9BURK|nr:MULTISPECIES: heavy metal translocating P-type ATPase [Paraburkholderia]MBK3813330.1 heavy metal translocating P-type ATPase [Paraburkholderia aspalathi]CAE6794611.1 Potassium-transporting ATPase ATP-binding subunit [Paraburkholderia nemoris]